jgi:4-hydroxybenzoate polyprenyltransferase
MSRSRTYAQLLRLPNVFTALADICLGALATWGATGAAPAVWWPAFLAALAASGCLYCAGMVWNDFFDLEQDQRERPFRPLPSGRVTRAEAARLGAGLLGAGLMLAGLAGWHADAWDGTPLALAAFLAVTILLYDGWLKRTWMGPLGMGTCRFLNVLLALSAVRFLSPSASSPGAAGGSSGWGIHLAAVVGVYIVGVTWFARTEARTSRRSELAAAAGVMLAALALALPAPTWFPPDTSSPAFPYLLVGLGFLVGIPVWYAIQEPTPARVQAAVKRAIFGLVILDATLATAVAGTVGLVILVLLLPAMYLGRWVYST